MQATFGNISYLISLLEAVIRKLVLCFRLQMLIKVISHSYRLWIINREVFLISTVETEVHTEGMTTKLLGANLSDVGIEWNLKDTYSLIWPHTSAHEKKKRTPS